MYSNFAYFKIILKHCTHKLKYIYIFDKYFFLSNTKNSFKTTETYQCTKTRRKHLVFLNKSKNYTSNRLGDGLALILYFKYKNNDLGGKTFALWGLAFKPDTDDIREAPALEIIDALTNAGAKVVAFDPEAMPNVKKRLAGNDNVAFVDEKYTALNQADALIIATEWPEFGEPDFEKLKQSLKAPVVFDGRNLYKLEVMKDQGFYYASVGRSIVKGGK